MLAIDLRPIVTDHAAHIELGINADVCQLAPRPQREVFAIASLDFLEDPGMLPEIPLAKQLEVGSRRRGEARWITSARTSFPVPVSPSNRIARSLAATRAAS